jgi:transcriptional regulator with XRE-family HTH domain
MKINEAAFYRALAKNIRARRLELNLRQEELAARLDIERTTLTHIEAARQKPPLHLYFLLCRELHVEPERLLPTWAAVEEKAMASEQASEDVTGVRVVGAGTPRITPLLSTFLQAARAEESDTSSTPDTSERGGPEHEQTKARRDGG